MSDCKSNDETLPATAGSPEGAGGTTVSSGPAAGFGSRVRYIGDYELLDEVARGGMGVVWRARQVSLNRTVAVKMILTGQFANEVEVKRFRVEAEAAANLQHPNIVSIHEVGKHEGQHYFSMDFIEGQSLTEYVAGKQLTLPEIARLTRVVAEAVHYAHQRGTLHRDLKPQNILVGSDGQPHITDFGLAKRWRTPEVSEPNGAEHVAATDPGLTQHGAVMGSPSYMAPEQASPGMVGLGPPTDVYALGGILYELLTGRPPHRGSTPLETLQLVRSVEPQAVNRLRSDVPVDLETICHKCLHREPERRYPTARQLAEDLERFLRGEPILAKPASAARMSWSWLLRNPWAVTGCIAILVFGLGLLAYGLWETSRYLAWKVAHPGQQLELFWLVKAEFRVWQLSVAAVAMAVGLWSGFDSFGRKSAGAKISRGRSSVHLAAAGIFLASVLWTLGAAIRVCVWAEVFPATMAMIAMLALPYFWMAGEIMRIHVQEIHSSITGVAAPPSGLFGEALRTKVDGPYSYLKFVRLIRAQMRSRRTGADRRRDAWVTAALLVLLVAILIGRAWGDRDLIVQACGCAMGFGLVWILAGLVWPVQMAATGVWGKAGPWGIRIQAAASLLAAVGIVYLLRAADVPFLRWPEAMAGSMLGVVAILLRIRREDRGTSRV